MIKLTRIFLFPLSFCFFWIVSSSFLFGEIEKKNDQSEKESLFTAQQKKVNDTTLVTQEGFALPQEGYHFLFPRDYGSHPRFKIEWWYLTGHLHTVPTLGNGGSSEKPNQFGFETTFFRQAAKSPLANKGKKEAKNPEAPLFGSDHFFLTDVALLDHQAADFSYQKRLNREGWDAFAKEGSLDLRNGNWSLKMEDEKSATMLLHVSVGGDRLLALELTPMQPMVVFGKKGVSRKGKETSALSYYMTFPRLKVTGSLTHFGKEEKRLALEGEAWMDHEVSSSQLDRDEEGWDWCSLQLRDGWSVMAYVMRQKTEKTEKIEKTGRKVSPFSTINWISPKSELTQYSPEKFGLTPVSFWESPHTGDLYPVEMKLVAQDPRTQRWVSWFLRPFKKDQELVAPDHVSYWEGECAVEDKAGKPIGVGFLELTGYDHLLTQHLHQ